MKVIWTARAVADLIDVAEYINQHNPSSAVAIRNRIRAATMRLGEFPLSGRPGRVAETRELVVPGTDFLVPYRVSVGRVEILAILHAARDWPDAF